MLGFLSEPSTPQGGGPGGHVAKFMGDGVHAYFGWPMAHEDAAERAVRTVLAAAAAVPGLATPADEPLAARVGIATSRVVVGDLVGDEQARERAVVGETPNLAARLQGLASPGTVVVAEATRRLLGGLFAYRELGPLELKGFAGPVPAFAVLFVRGTWAASTPARRRSPTVECATPLPGHRPVRLSSGVAV